MISTASVELVKAKAAQQRARDAEWDTPDDPIVKRARMFWDSEVDQLAALPPDEVMPLF